MPYLNAAISVAPLLEQLSDVSWRPQLCSLLRASHLLLTPREVPASRGAAVVLANFSVNAYKRRDLHNAPGVWSMLWPTGATLTVLRSRQGGYVIRIARAVESGDTSSGDSSSADCSTDYDSGGSESGPGEDDEGLQPIRLHARQLVEFPTTTAAALRVGGVADPAIVVTTTGAAPTAFTVVESSGGRRLRGTPFQAAAATSAASAASTPGAHGGGRRQPGIPPVTPAPPQSQQTPLPATTTPVPAATAPSFNVNAVLHHYALLPLLENEGSAEQQESGSGISSFASVQQQRRRLVDLQYLLALCVIEEGNGRQPHSSLPDAQVHGQLQHLLAPVQPLCPGPLTVADRPPGETMSASADGGGPCQSQPQTTAASAGGAPALPVLHGPSMLPLASMAEPSSSGAEEVTSRSATTTPQSDRVGGLSRTRVTTDAGAADSSSRGDKAG